MTEKTAVIYCRISADATDEGLGVQRQEQLCREYAQTHKIAVSRVFTDNDTGASNLSRKPRPRYEDMLKTVEAGGVDVIIAYSNSRLTRRPAEWITLINLANAGKVEIKTIASGSHDLSTADGRAVAITIAAWDAAEAERTGERVKAAAKQRAERGLPKKGRYRTFGYTKDFKIVEDEAVIIRDGFRRVIAGHSLQSIASLWRSTNVTMGNGKEIHFSTVKNVVKRPMYAGIAMHKGVEVGVSAVPPIIDRATFDAAQKVLNGSAKPRGKNARKYLLSGLVFCSECMFPMMGSPGYVMADGIRQHVYACRTVLGGCGSLGVSGINLELIVLDQVRRSLILGGTPGKNKPVPVDFTPQIQKVEDEIKAYQAAVKAEQMEARDAITLIGDLSKKRRALESLEAEQATQAVLDHERFLDWDNFCEATLSEQKAITSMIVQRIVVHPATGTQWDAKRVELTLSTGKVVRATWQKKWSFHPFGVVDGWRQHRREQLKEAREFVAAKQAEKTAKA